MVKNLPADAGNVGSIPGLRRSPGERNGNPLQYCYLENSMDRGVWWTRVHGARKSQRWLRDWAHIHVCINNESESCDWVVTASLWRLYMTVNYTVIFQRAERSQMTLMLAFSSSIFQMLNSKLIKIFGWRPGMKLNFRTYLFNSLLKKYSNLRNNWLHIEKYP